MRLRVEHAFLGYAPFPKGHAVEAAHWSLLDPVRARAPMWRDPRR